MDYLDSSIKIAQTVIPPAFQYFGKAKEREAKLAQTNQELAHANATVEVLVMKNRELRQSQAEAEKKNQELRRVIENLEAFRNIVLILIAVAAVAYIGMALTSKAA
jgi:ABC-type siderophore export system fused ATPase/permease subunit